MFNEFFTTEDKIEETIDMMFKRIDELNAELQALPETDENVPRAKEIVLEVTDILEKFLEAVGEDDLTEIRELRNQLRNALNEELV